jgi:hypothetical protein
MIQWPGSSRLPPRPRLGISHTGRSQLGRPAEMGRKFVGGNMKSPNDMHMHNATYTFVDQDTLRTKWIHHENGKPANDVVLN